METGYINSSANYAAITANNAKYVGGILGYVDNESFNGITSTLNVGKITGKIFEITENEKQYTMTPGEIIGYLGKHVASSVYANYTLGENAFGVIIDEALNPVSITSTKEELASGKITYLLGSKFGQKIDNLKEEETKDAYPLVGATPVYQVTSCDGTTIKYSNLNENDAHEYIYNKDGNVIYETCNICYHNKKLELLSPNDPYYDKTIKAARLSTDIEGLDVNSIEIKYDREVLFPGTYTASITYQGLTITHEFEILKGIPKVEMFTYHEPGELVYDGNNKYLDLYSTKEPGMGKVVVKYSRDNKKLDNICDAGLYFVVLSVEDGIYYEAHEFSILDNFKQVTIKPKEIPYVKDAGTYTVYYKVVGNKNYADVEEQSFEVTVEKATLTLTADSFTIEQFTALPSFTYVADVSNVTDLTPVMTVSITDTNTVGEYDITILEIDKPNYNITYVNGTLTITKHTQCRGGTATCTKKAECVLCKEEYGEKAQHSFNDYKYNNDATSSSNGTVTSKCEHCDETNTILLENTMLPSGGENNNPGLGDNNSKPKNKLGICIGSISMLLIGAALYFFVLRKKK